MSSAVRFTSESLGDAGILLFGPQVREQPPDLMFLDLNIPGASGADVLKEVKADPATADVRVIIVTATGEEGRDFVLGLGADEYFTKPFSPTALLRTVERVLDPGGAPPATT